MLFLTGGAIEPELYGASRTCCPTTGSQRSDHGYWAEKTFEESKFYSSRCYEAWDGRAVKHAYCPGDAEIRYGATPVYVHMCSNNTIYGTQWRNADGSERLPKIPEGSVLVNDASSDIYSRPIDVSRYGMIYAGAQKNIGIAGTTLAIIREDLLRPARRLPTMLRYETHAKDQSRHNTPPAFAIYMSGQVFQWILDQGGLAAMHARNLEKAKIIYDALDTSRFWKAHARADSRSMMNITFKVSPEVKNAERWTSLFIKEAFKNGMDQLQGTPLDRRHACERLQRVPDRGLPGWPSSWRSLSGRTGDARRWGTSRLLLTAVLGNDEQGGAGLIGAASRPRPSLESEQTRPTPGDNRGDRGQNRVLPDVARRDRLGAERREPAEAAALGADAARKHRRDRPHEHREIEQNNPRRRASPETQHERRPGQHLDPRDGEGRQDHKVTPSGGSTLNP